ncbi:hypothetical protein C8A01DRAFT_16826 [Parachaetomium inaequale]|uniref:Uncharacterized protein n=1 Tax=Parachaetomium inaequale TaxID=2588326 RepID=A0AAN6PFN6_9PEZI|nr:hypothetical protein C8A01DRAFT_16826 [Parachaetomium inaequale]
MRGGPGTSAAPPPPPRGLTLPMRYLMRKRLKNPAPLEITERRQVGDVEAIFKPSPSPSGAADQQQTQKQQKQQHYPARGSDSEL